jgi:hypothetical protein
MGILLGASDPRLLPRRSRAFEQETWNPDWRAGYSVLGVSSMGSRVVIDPDVAQVEVTP